MESLAALINWTALVFRPSAAIPCLLCAAVNTGWPRPSSGPCSPGLVFFLCFLLTRLSLSATN